MYHEEMTLNLNYFYSAEINNKVKFDSIFYLLDFVLLCHIQCIIIKDSC